MNNINDYYAKYKALRVKKNLKGKEALNAVKQCGYALRYVKDQTKEICLEAVKQDGYALEHVKEQTEEICLEAVKQNGCVLRYVNENIFHKDKIKVIANGKEVFISLDSAESLGLV